SRSRAGTSASGTSSRPRPPATCARSRPAASGPAGSPSTSCWPDERRRRGGPHVKVGMVGLGRMGGNMAARLRDKGHEVVGYDPFSADADVDSLEALVAALAPPRVVWVMVPAGQPTEGTVVGLGGLLAAGDVVVEGGNSNWRDSVRRAEHLGQHGIGYVDAGTSGGIWGRTEGYCLMVGGAD